ncbi:MAG: hypothetical protein KGL39_25520 [Patescibacteria group bacterium]|nr:hypothetical protein [Patescibacteria group bacterium]
MAQTIDEKIKDLREKRAALTEKLDAGEITPEEQLTLHGVVNDILRLMRHQKRVAAQKPLPENMGELHAFLREEFRVPFTQDDLDASPGALDTALYNVQDALDADNLVTVLYTLMRVARKVYAWNMHHLPTIDWKAAEEQKGKRQ